MRKKLVAAVAVLGLAFTIAAPAFAFTTYNPAETDVSSAVNHQAPTHMSAYQGAARQG